MSTAEHTHTPQHVHVHGHGHAHTGDGHNYVESNRKHFDAEAGNVEAMPEALELGRNIVNSMKNKYPALFNKDSTTVLDFACGPGIISREIGADAKSIIGVDISQGMIDIFNKRVTEHGFSPENMKGVRADLKGEEGELDGQKFDIITCASSYHHFPSIEETTKILAFFLKPGGSLLISDQLKEEDKNDKIPDQFKHVIAHIGGFTENNIKKTFESAGLVDFEFANITTLTLFGVEKTIFLARGVKPL